MTALVPIKATIIVRATDTGRVVVSIAVPEKEIDWERLKTYALMAHSALEAHGFARYEFEFLGAVWHPDRNEYLYDTAFRWNDRQNANVLTIRPRFERDLLARLPVMAKALIVPMSHSRVAFAPALKTNIRGFSMKRK